MEDNRPIYNMLTSLYKKNTHSFCMPGHKRNANFYEDFYNLDYTEIDETDNLHNPSSIIKKSMEITAGVFRAEHSYFLVNGSSSGIIASLLAHLKEGDRVLIPKNSHISVYNGVILSGAIPIYVYPSIKGGIPCGIDINNIKKAINKYDNIKAFVLTSTTYEGFSYDIPKLSSLLHEKGILLIVDEAHGGHFVCSDKLPTPAIISGGDICIQSFHKTLPALTQCSVLHINDSPLVNKNMLESCLSMVQTTSPSYMFMCSIEYATDFVKNNKQNYEKYIQNIINLRNDLKDLKNVAIINKDFLNNTHMINLDITRLSFFINSEKDGNFINSMLKDNNIQIEMYSKNHIIAISTIADTMDSLNHFKNTIINIDKSIPHKPLNKDVIFNNKITTAKYPLKNLIHKEKTKINLFKAKNMVCASFIIPYPPGVPILSIGDIITEEDITTISDLLKANVHILGIDNFCIDVYKLNL